MILSIKNQNGVLITDSNGTISIPNDASNNIAKNILIQSSFCVKITFKNGPDKEHAFPKSSFFHTGGNKSFVINCDGLTHIQYDKSGSENGYLSITPLD